MFFSIVLIAAGLAGLWFGTRGVVSAALGLAARLQLSQTFVGIAVLAVGTDLPELFVTLKASVLQLQGQEASGIIAGNAIGSSIAQLALILGLAGMLLPFTVPRLELRRDGTALLGAVLLLWLFGRDGQVGRLEGTLLLLAYAAYLGWLFRSQARTDIDPAPAGSQSLLHLSGTLLAGFVILIVASHLVVENALVLAAHWGVEQSFVGIVIIGLGTSLPELAVSLGAALRRSAALSVGNIIGSNIFDCLVPVGVASAITPTDIAANLLHFDLPVLFSATVLAVAMLWWRGIARTQGAVLILVYCAYLASKVVAAS